VNIDTKHQPLLLIADQLEDMQVVGQKIAAQLTFPSCVYLHGNMGAGKTTLCKSIIKAFGYQNEVTSPTYNLIQEYQVEQGVIYHMDLYRLEDPSELEYLAVEDLWSSTSLFLIEWPEKGGRYLRKQDADISIKVISGVTDGARNISLNG